MEILRIENLTFNYPGRDISVLSNVSFSVQKGEFVTLCGATGSGKSTLLKLLKREIAPMGSKKGEIYLCGKNINDLSENESAFSVGYVMQRPEQQIVTDKVWHEIAFGLENLGLDKNTISRRVSEISSYFGIEDWYERDVNTLSGGQKQMLNLASVLAMNPKVLILDEPTSQLDPIAASEFINSLKKINRDLDITIIIAEHRLEDVIPISDKLMILEKGKITSFDNPRNSIREIKHNKKLLNYMPMPSRFFCMTDGEGECPLDVREGRIFIEEQYAAKVKNINFSQKDKKEENNTEKAVELKSVYFKYEKNAPDVLSSLDITVFKNEIFSIFGGNGSGKTTMLSVMLGLERPYSGNVKIFDKKIKEYKGNSLYKECVSYLPQDVQTVFLEETVGAELSFELDLPFDISDLKNHHPYDLSGGEMQLVALFKVLEKNPKILFLDEPTKGIDPNSKIKLVSILKGLKEKGMTIVMVTHDIEFASLCSDRCAMLFNGKITSVGETRDFFSGNNFYTTSINKMTRDISEGIITLDDLLSCDKAF